MSDIYRASHDKHWTDDDEAELARRLVEEKAIDAPAPERVLLIADDPYEDLDGPRTGSAALRRLEDGGSF